MKRTIYINPTTAAQLDAENAPNLSARVAEMAASMVRYRAILDEAMPTLAENEWALLCDVLNGSTLTATHGGNDPARTIAQTVEASGEDMASKWGMADLPAFAARLRALPYPAQCAIIETVARFWRQTGNSLDPIGQKLRAAGAKVASGERHIIPPPCEICGK